MISFKISAQLRPRLDEFTSFTKDLSEEDVAVNLISNIKLENKVEIVDVQYESESHLWLVTHSYSLRRSRI
jgi:hypothetical protein